MPATGKALAATNFDNRTTIADVKIYLKEFMFKKKNFILHRAKLIISAQIVGSNPTVQWWTGLDKAGGDNVVSQGFHWQKQSSLLIFCMGEKTS